MSFVWRRVLIAHSTDHRRGQALYLKWHTATQGYEPTRLDPRSIVFCTGILRWTRAQGTGRSEQPVQSTGQDGLHYTSPSTSVNLEWRCSHELDPVSHSDRIRAQGRRCA